MIPNSIPVDRKARWELAARLIERWFGSSLDGDRGGVAQLDLEEAERRLGITVPESLREWYVRFGARVDVWNVQDTFVLPSALRISQTRACSR